MLSLNTLRLIAKNPVLTKKPLVTPGTKPLNYASQNNMMQFALLDA